MKAPVALLGALALATGCGSPAALLATPPAYAPQDQVKAGVIKNQDDPLIIEWPAAQRTKLESLARRGAVAVRYEGDAIDVLGQCRVPRAYGYTSTTPQRERVTIHDRNDLRATLPIGAASLEGTLKKAGELNVSLTIVGTFEAAEGAVRRDELEGDCAAATHVVTALTVGAFEFSAGADASLGAGASVGRGPASTEIASAGSSAKREILNQAGDQAACAKATGEDKTPPYGCGALLRVEVVRLLPPRHEAMAAAPTPPLPPASAEPPPAAPPRPAATPSDFTAYTPVAPELSSQPPSPGASGKSSSAPIVVLGTVGALALIGGVIGGVIVATKEDPKTPGTGGLGSGAAAFSGVPVLQW